VASDHQVKGSNPFGPFRITIKYITCIFN